MIALATEPSPILPPPPVSADVGHPSATPVRIVAAIVQCGEDACRCYHGVVRIYDRVAWVSRTWPRIGEDPQRLISETRAYLAGWRADGYAVDDTNLEAFARANPPPKVDRKNMH